MSVPTLGVVMPVYNEEHWVTRSLPALEEAAARAGWPLEIVAVDDGSTDGTGAVLDRYAAEGRLRVIHGPNRGRFEARRAGLDALGTADTLLIDARVLIHADSLRHVIAERANDPSLRVWNAHVDVASEQNLYAAFWAGLTKVGWRAYFANPRPVTFGIEEFNSYPKGTTMFLAPRELLLAATESFDSVFDDVRLASDDTRMLRHVAEAASIHIDPGFSCTYHGRDAFSKWLKQSYFRGTTFVDGYLGEPGRTRTASVTLAAAAVAGTAVLARRPRWAASAVGAGVAVAAAAAKASGATPKETAAVAGLLVPFAAVFGTGFVRGLVLAGRAR